MRAVGIRYLPYGNSRKQPAKFRVIRRLKALRPVGAAVIGLNMVAGGHAVSLSQREMRGARAFAAPLLGVILLVACYLVLAEWDQLPTLIGATLTAVHWPV
jgi:hypothetical protein